MRNKIILTYCLLTVALLALLLPGCGRNEGGGGPVHGELRRLWNEPPTLDPHLAGDVSSGQIVDEVFGGLVTLDLDLKVVPDLAERWEISPDGRIYTFFLRRDARFQNGKAVTAADVKYSFERIADPKTQSTTVDTYLGDVVGVKEKLRGQTNEIAGVKVIDEYTIQITIDSPKVYFLAKLTYPTAFVLDRQNVESGEQWFKHPNGTGPFKLAEYTPGEVILLERNELYHLGVAKLQRVRFILSGGAPMIMYENSEIDLTNVGLPDLDRVLNPASSLKKEAYPAPPGFQLGYIAFNLNKPPLDDIKVRQALVRSVNKKQIAEKVLLGLQIPAKGILPPGFPGFNPEQTGLTYDPAKAISLLAQSKYGPDISRIPAITLTVPGALGVAVGPELQAILAMWRDTLGLDVRVQQMEFATFLGQVRASKLQMWSLGWVVDYPDPQDILDLLFDSQSQVNETGYNNPEVDRLLVQARAETDEGKRLAEYRQAENIIVEDSPLMPLWHPGDGYVLIKPWLKDYYLTRLVIPKYRYAFIEAK